MTAAILALLFLAQQNTATISGRVLDSSGAAVPGAMVVARNVETGLERPAITDETGAYTGCQSVRTTSAASWPASRRQLKLESFSRLLSKRGGRM